MVATARVRCETNCAGNSETAEVKPTTRCCQVRRLNNYATKPNTAMRMRFCQLKAPRLMSSFLGFLYTNSHLLLGPYSNFFSFPLLLFRSLFLSLEFVRLSHSLINTVLLCYCVTVVDLLNCSDPVFLIAKLCRSGSGLCRRRYTLFSID